MTNIGFRLKMDVEKLDEYCNTLGIDRSKMANMALELITEFEPELLKGLIDYAEKLRLPLGIVIKNKVIKDFALQAGKDEFYKKELDSEPVPEVLEEYAMTNKGPLTGKELFNKFKRKGYGQEKEQYIKHLAKRAEGGGSLDEVEEKLLEEKELSIERSTGSDTGVEVGDFGWEDELQ